MIVYSRDEYKQWAMQRALDDQRLRFFLGDVRDLRRTTDAVQRADIVVHTAALKHVTAMEYNPDQAVATNILGTQNVIDAVRHSPVRKAILLSTDKACAPANLYGVTKACAERLWIASNVHKPAFSMVRYGNVMESRGGVLELWQQAIADGKEIKITDHTMTRFWMTYPMAIEAVSLAVKWQAGLAVIHKAPSFTLGALADALGAAKRVTVPRGPGEKTHEILMTEYESHRCWNAGEAYVLRPEVPYDDNVQWDHGGEKIPDGFWLSSDAQQMMSVEEIRRLL